MADLCRQRLFTSLCPQSNTDGHQCDVASMHSPRQNSRFAAKLEEFGSASLFHVLNIRTRIVDARPPLVIATLDTSEANQLTHLTPETNRRIQECGLISVHNRLLPNKINLMGLKQLGLVDDFPDWIEPWNEELHGVIGEEARYIPGHVAGVAIVATNKEHPHNGKVGAVWLEIAVVRKSSSINTLSFASTVVENVRQGHDEEIDEAC